MESSSIEGEGAIDETGPAAISSRTTAGQRRSALDRNPLIKVIGPDDICFVL
jgi:hypothetical protein